jgi:hypothetical protein
MLPAKRGSFSQGLKPAIFLVWRGTIEFVPSKETQISTKQRQPAKCVFRPTLAAITRTRCPEGAQKGHTKFNSVQVGEAGERLTQGGSIVSLENREHL